MSFSSRPDRGDADPGWPTRQASSRFSQCMNQILDQLGLGIHDTKHVTCVLAESPIRLGAPREEFVPAPPQNNGLSWGSQACKPAQSHPFLHLSWWAFRRIASECWLVRCSVGSGQPGMWHESGTLPAKARSRARGFSHDQSGSAFVRRRSTVMSCLNASSNSVARAMPCRCAQLITVSLCRRHASAFVSLRLRMTLAIMRAPDM